MVDQLCIGFVPSVNKMIVANGKHGWEKCQARGYQRQWRWTLCSASEFLYRNSSHLPLPPSGSRDWSL